MFSPSNRILDTDDILFQKMDRCSVNDLEYDDRMDIELVDLTSSPEHCVNSPSLNNMSLSNGNESETELYEVQPELYQVCNQNNRTMAMLSTTQQLVSENSSNTRYVELESRTTDEINDDKENLAIASDMTFAIDSNLTVRSVGAKKVQLESTCPQCEYYEKIYNQARIYYNAGALKLAKAEKLKQKVDRENKKVREDARKYYSAADLKIQRLLSSRNEILNLKWIKEELIFERKAAVKARTVLKNQSQKNQI